LRRFRIPFFVIVVCSLLSFVSCQKETPKSESPSIEAVTLLGDTLYTALSNSEDVLKKYHIAQLNYERESHFSDVIVWYGRRTAYLGRFQDAIAIYSKGLLENPNDARIYRHRGHRYITTRQYDKAIADFEKAAKLIEGTEDTVEPDGLPNERNIPLSTLHGNIWYHLGLAYYLQNDMDNALKAYSNRTVTERYPDNLVSGGYWLYMINRRLGNVDAANAVIEKVVKDMDIIENGSYYKMCLFFKGLIPEEEIANQTIGTSSSDVLAYGLGNWYLFEKNDTLKAKALYEHLLEKGNKYSFAYLSAESDYKRLFAKD
jgi:tetratricopeptide (TPR) repeat protein